MITDSEGRVWLRREQLEDGASVWAIVERTGGLGQFVRTTDRTTILAATSTRVFTVRTDELGVEYVEIYALSDG